MQSAAFGKFAQYVATSETEVLLVGYSVSCRGLPEIMYDLLRLSMIFFL